MPAACIRQRHSRGLPGAGFIHAKAASAAAAGGRRCGGFNHEHPSIRWPEHRLAWRMRDATVPAVDHPGSIAGTMIGKPDRACVSGRVPAGPRDRVGTSLLRGADDGLAAAAGRNRSSINSRWRTQRGSGQMPALPAQGIDYRNRSMRARPGASDSRLRPPVTPTPTTCGFGPPRSAHRWCRNGTTSRTQPGYPRSRIDSPIH